jgi:hypothetical protein
MTIKYFSAAEPNTPFAPNFKIPIYYGQANDGRFMGFLSQHIRDLEKNYISKEELISEVPKSQLDPIEFTQHWKQHNIVGDIALETDPVGFRRFPGNFTSERLFNLIRHHYLTYLDMLNFERRKVYIHTWANVLRAGEYISPHTHDQSCNGYLSCNIFVTASDANFILEKESNNVIIASDPGVILFWPSCLSHHTDAHNGKLERITISSDIVVPEYAKEQPHRPYRLLDDPETMPGLYDEEIE